VYEISACCADKLQSLLDQGGEVYIPGGDYVIAKTLKIGSNTRLHLAHDAVIHLADGANCVMLENEALHVHGKNSRITVTGGTWDGNNANQQRGQPGKIWTIEEDCFYAGILMRFVGVDHFALTDTVLKDPESYSVLIADVRYFTVEHITFDHNLLRPNMDGVHVNGPARFGYIHDIKGATNDDLVALNAGEDVLWLHDGLDITDVEVDGLYADCGYTAVRLLSSNGDLRNVSISNIFGTYRFYAVSFTHHDLHPGAPVLLENVTISNVYASKPTWMPDPEKTFYYQPSHQYYAQREPLLWFAKGITARNVTLSNIRRREESVTHAVTVKIDETARVENLTLQNLSQQFTACEPVPMVVNEGDTPNLRVENVQEI